MPILHISQMNSIDLAQVVAFPAQTGNALPLQYGRQKKQKTCRIRPQNEAQVYRNSPIKRSMPSTAQGLPVTPITLTVYE